MPAVSFEIELVEEERRTPTLKGTQNAECIMPNAKHRSFQRDLQAPPTTPNSPPPHPICSASVPSTNSFRNATHVLIFASRYCRDAYIA